MANSTKQEPTTSARGLLAVMFAAGFLAAFNESVVNVALVDIMGEFGISANAAQWMVAGYLIVTTVVVSIVVWMQKRFDLRTLFFGAGACVIVGALVDMVAPIYPVLLAFRLVQAVGSGIFIPTMMVVVLALAPRDKLGTYFAIGSACINVGPAVSPLASGALVTMFGWRTLFALPAVAMALICLAGVAFVKPLDEPTRQRLDVASVAASAIGLALFTFGLQTISTNVPAAVALLAAGTAAFALFARRQLHLKTPVLDVRPLANWHFALACVLVLVSMIPAFTLSVLVPLYFEQALGATAMAAGATLMVPVLATAIVTVVSGRALDRFGPWPLLPAGYALLAAGLALLVAVASNMSLPAIALAAALAYAAAGMTISPIQTVGLVGLPDNQQQSGVALVNTFIQLAGSIEPPLFVGIMSSRMAMLESQGSTLAVVGGFSAAVAVAAGIALAATAVAVPYALHARSRLK